MKYGNILPPLRKNACIYMKVCYNLCKMIGKIGGKI